MTSKEESFSCSGLNGSLTLYADRMVINNTGLGFSKSYQLPIKRITSVVVDRKSVVPFASFTLLAAAMTVLTRYNSLWFLVNLSPENAGTASSAAIMVTVFCAIPTIFRMLFVNLFITWDGDPTSFRIGFARVGPGKRLARKFQELASWG